MSAYCEKCHDYHREVGIESLCARLTALEQRGVGVELSHETRAMLDAATTLPSPPPPAEPGEEWQWSANGWLRAHVNTGLPPEVASLLAAEFARIDAEAERRGYEKGTKRVRCPKCFSVPEVWFNDALRYEFKCRPCGWEQTDSAAALRALERAREVVSDAIDSFEAHASLGAVACGVDDALVKLAAELRGES